MPGFSLQRTFTTVLVDVHSFKRPFPASAPEKTTLSWQLTILGLVSTNRQGNGSGSMGAGASTGIGVRGSQVASVMNTIAAKITPLSCKTTGPKTGTIMPAALVFVSEEVSLILCILSFW